MNTAIHYKLEDFENLETFEEYIKARIGQFCDNAEFWKSETAWVVTLKFESLLAVWHLGARESLATIQKDTDTMLIPTAIIQYL